MKGYLVWVVMLQKTYIYTVYLEECEAWRPPLTFRVSIEVINKVGDSVVECCGRDAVAVLAVIHKLQALSLVHSYQDVIVKELPLVV